MPEFLGVSDRKKQLVTEILLQYREDYQSVPDEWPYRIGKTWAFVIEHFTEQCLGSKEVMRAMGITSNTFLAEFKVWTGKSISKWIEHHRIEVAKKILGERGFKLTEVSLLVGFSNVVTFARSFKRVVGVTPGQF